MPANSGLRNGQVKTKGCTPTRGSSVPTHSKGKLWSSQGTVKKGGTSKVTNPTHKRK